MNPPIRKLTAVVIVMFLTLMLAVTYIQFFRAPELNADQRNVRTLYREYGTDRGPIIVYGTPIVTSEPYDDELNYLRTYHQPYLYAPITGYFSTSFNSMTGLERAENSVLGGSDSSLLSQRIEDLITGSQPQGGAVSLTIDPLAQEAAYNALNGRRGAVVAIEPSTGKILALVSTPSFDPNTLATRDAASASAQWEAYNSDPNKPLINRAIAGDLYPPGSTFKVITTAAMIEVLGMDETTEVEAPFSYAPPGTTHEIFNSGQVHCGNGSGTTTLLTAFTESCNTTFAIYASEIGGEELQAMAEGFGFNAELSIPLTVTPSQFPAPADEATLAMDAIGQRDIIATPLQMAMVAAAIANDGVLMQPYLVNETLTADLEVLSTTRPRELGEPISAETAQILQTMMVSVVNHGSGSYAALSSTQIAGKTGTAEVAGAQPYSWFIAFDAVDNPQVAVAVVVEEGGYGGPVAGPIAQAVLSAVIDQ
ncbi:MAG: penicillin-binding protein 2 [Actinomycetaceae bacterium]|nr:penicillin-binding protein 2 [Actinomycetaceae bacterium]